MTATVSEKLDAVNLDWRVANDGYRWVEDGHEDGPLLKARGSALNARSAVRPDLDKFTAIESLEDVLAYAAEFGPLGGSEGFTRAKDWGRAINAVKAAKRHRELVKRTDAASGWDLEKETRTVSHRASVHGEDEPFLLDVEDFYGEIVNPKRGVRVAARKRLVALMNENLESIKTRIVDRGEDFAVRLSVPTMHAALWWFLANGHSEQFKCKGCHEWFPKSREGRVFCDKGKCRVKATEERRREAARLFAQGLSAEDVHRVVGGRLSTITKLAPRRRRLLARVGGKIGGK